MFGDQKEQPLEGKDADHIRIELGVVVSLRTAGEHAIEQLLEFANSVDAKIHLVHVNTDDCPSKKHGWLL